jgi:hypothetical protein
MKLLKMYFLKVSYVIKIKIINYDDDSDSFTKKRITF